MDERMKSHCRAARRATEQLLGDEVTPIGFKMNREAQRLTVTWKDGHVSEFDLLSLRGKCPCAACAAKRGHGPESTEPSSILKQDPGQGPPPPRAVGAQLVGSYAIQLQWSDGHDAGIYDFRYLRALDASE